MINTLHKADRERLEWEEAVELLRKQFQARPAYGSAGIVLHFHAERLDRIDKILTESVKAVNHG